MFEVYEYETAEEAPSQRRRALAYFHGMLTAVMSGQISKEQATKITSDLSKSELPEDVRDVYSAAWLLLERSEGR